MSRERGEIPDAATFDVVLSSPAMGDLSSKNFGYQIAYVLPGFVALWGISPLSTAIQEWLSPSPNFPAGIESVVFVGMASVTAGMIVSAARWFLIDSLHAITGLKRPTWNDEILPERLSAFESLVDAHYRHYQFYANMMVSIAIAFFVAIAMRTIPAASSFTIMVAFLATESLLLSASRSNLNLYYRRTGRLLKLTHARKEVKHDQRPRKTETQAHIRNEA